MLTTNDETVLYDKLQESKKELMGQQRLLELKIKILSTLKKKHHPLRLSVLPVMKFIRDIEDKKKDNVDIDEITLTASILLNLFSVILSLHLISGKGYFVTVRKHGQPSRIITI